MGAGQAKEISGGYRIVRICEDGPVSMCDLEIFFDYIVQIDDLQLIDASRSTYDNFIEKVRQNEGKEVMLKVYNCRYNQVKDIKVTPRKWHGKGLLGININYESMNAMNEGIRILEICKDSPAFKSSLVEYDDYIIGHDNNILRNQGELVKHIHMHCLSYYNENKTQPFNMYLYVYNKNTETIRKVPVEYNASWAGKGVLGCNIGTGYIHRIPNCKWVKTDVAKETNGVEQPSAGTGTNWDTYIEKDSSPHGGGDKEKSSSPSRDGNNYMTKLQCDDFYKTYLGDGGIKREENKSDEFYFKGDMHNTFEMESADEEDMCAHDGHVSMLGYSSVNNYEQSETIEMDSGAGYKNETDEMTTIEKNEMGHTTKFDKKETSDTAKLDKKETGDMAKVDNSLTGETDDVSEKGGLVHSYSEYVRNMKIYSKEMIEIYESMNKNSELLNSIKMKTLENYSLESNNTPNEWKPSYRDGNYFSPSFEKGDINTEKILDEGSSPYTYEDNQLGVVSPTNTDMLTVDTNCASEMRTVPQI
ncbi:golgi re-assembly stacking protein 1, putative [Plasmodium ovale]|uniref:Golgi re-assembly stacking protein 1 n=2 Tax=Plasmodium ovale TaxID=36330 RepID=A0A1A8VLA2_PLAOA|nr:golgi re-assembly stacking protein 1 [Plasmodium ovale curtisi]SBS83672.1 golgi re-assembly stacking protein 1 [Plasmodium ovale curtisi]SCP03804.1 golgi re-assembly stacking protein 1, putative [Plasmodium ovale]